MFPCLGVVFVGFLPVGGVILLVLFGLWGGSVASVFMALLVAEPCFV